MASNNLHMAPHHTSKRYRKRPLWQWVIVYLIFAVIIYAAIYYFFSGSNLIDRYSY
jgi:hypothetical protein